MKPEDSHQGRTVIRPAPHLAPPQLAPRLPQGPQGTQSCCIGEQGSAVLHVRDGAQHSRTAQARLGESPRGATHTPGSEASCSSGINLSPGSKDTAARMAKPELHLSLQAALLLCFLICTHIRELNPHRPTSRVPLRHTCKQSQTMQVLRLQALTARVCAHGMCSCVRSRVRVGLCLGVPSARQAPTS